MAPFLHRLRLAAVDRIRYAQVTQCLRGMILATRSQIVRSRERQLLLAADAYRVWAAVHREGWIESRLREFVEDPSKASIWRDQGIGWAGFERHLQRRVVTKGLVLKAPISKSEKGVMLLSFEYNWLLPLMARDKEGLFRRYMILCASSWSPTHFPAVWSLSQIPGADIFFMISNAADPALLQRLRSGTRVVPFYISDWINPDDYIPRPRGRRTIDILMVANWAPFKRHWLLFKALREMKRPLRVMLVGQPEAGRTLEHVRREAALFGVEKLVELQDSLGVEEVAELMCNSKISLILSRREGSCVVVTESMFADTPVGLLRGAHIGSAAYINAQTGAFLDERNLAADLATFLDNCEQFHPRDWATRHISCQKSTRRLNAALREHALASGQTWTHDICLLGCRPNPCYVRREDADAMLPAYEELRHKHDLVFSVATSGQPALAEKN